MSYSTHSIDRIAPALAGMRPRSRTAVVAAALPFSIRFRTHPFARMA